MLMLLFLTTSVFEPGITAHADTGYSPIENELTLKTVMCGLVRHKDTGTCVSKKDDSYLTLTDCVGDRNIFCYDSVSRFIKLQDEDACATIESNKVVLRDCNQEENMKWVYTERGNIKKTSESACWSLDDNPVPNIVTFGSCQQLFYFQLMDFGDHKEENINMKTDKIVIMMNPVPIDEQDVHNYRFHVVLDMFTADENSSIGQIRVQMKSLSDISCIITVINWKDHGEEFSVYSKDFTSQLEKLKAGTADLILSSDTSGNIRVELDNETMGSEQLIMDKVVEDKDLNDCETNEENADCDAAFLQGADKVVLQWMDLGDENKNDADIMFNVSYKLLRRKFHAHSKQD